MNRKLILVLLSVFLFILVSVLGYFYFTKDSKSEQKNEGIKITQGITKNIVSTFESDTKVINKIDNDVPEKTIISSSQPIEQKNETPIETPKTKKADLDYETLKRFEITKFPNNISLLKIPTKILKSTPTAIFDTKVISDYIKEEQYYIFKDNNLILLRNNMNGVYYFEYKGKSFYFFDVEYESGLIEFYVADSDLNNAQEIKFNIIGYPLSYSVEKGDIKNLKILNRPSDGSSDEGEFKYENKAINIFEYMDKLSQKK